MQFINKGVRKKLCTLFIMMAQQGRPNMEKKYGTIIRSRTRGGFCSDLSR